MCRSYQPDPDVSDINHSLQNELLDSGEEEGAVVQSGPPSGVRPAHEKDTVHTRRNNAQDIVVFALEDGAFTPLILGTPTSRSDSHHLSKTVDSHRDQDPHTVFRRIEINHVYPHA